METVCGFNWIFLWFRNIISYLYFICMYIRNTYFLSYWNKEVAVSWGSTRSHTGHWSGNTSSPWQASLLPCLSDLTKHPMESDAEEEAVPLLLPFASLPRCPFDLQHNFSPRFETYTPATYEITCYSSDGWVKAHIAHTKCSRM